MAKVKIEVKSARHFKTNSLTCNSFYPPMGPSGFGRLSPVKMEYLHPCTAAELKFTCMLLYCLYVDNVFALTSMLNSLTTFPHEFISSVKLIVSNRC